jgi:hypothetical protein
VASFKGAVLDRKNPLFYRTLNGTQVGDSPADHRSFAALVHYVIDTPTYTYDADLVLRHRRDKQPAVTVNGPIKFTFVKSDMYIQDEDGKEIKLRMTKKTLKQGN